MCFNYVPLKIVTHFALIPRVPKPIFGGKWTWRVVKCWPMNKLLEICEKQNSRWPPVTHSESDYFLPFKIKVRSFYAIPHFRLNSPWAR